MSRVVQRPSAQSPSAPSSEAGPIVYIMSRFPKLSETFILREMLELERQGQPLVILPLLRMKSAVRHVEADRLMPKVRYTPFISPAIVAANLHYLKHSPGRYLALLWSALKGTWGSANLFIGAIGIFPKSVYFARLIEEEGILHVHAHFATHPALAALIASQLAGVGFSFAAHAHDFFVDTQMLCKKLENARFVVTHANFNKRYLLQLCPGIPADRIKVVHDGITLEQYEERVGKQNGGPFTILCVASLQPYKGIAYLVKACGLLKGKLRNFTCLIAGEGEERRRLERLIAELDLCEVVHLLGGQPQDRVTALLAEADLFVAPSVMAADGQMDTIPVAVIEAMASNLPVVSTRLSAIPEMVDDGVTGLLVPPGDERALAEAIVFLYQHGDLRDEMGRRGREKVAAEFQLAPIVAQLRALFGGVVAQETETRKWELEVKERIRRAVSVPFADLQPDDVLIGPRQGGAGHDSEVYDVTLRGRQGGKRELILKLLRPAPSTPEGTLEEARKCARREHEALSFLWREFSRHSKCLTVPRPLAHFPESAAVLMEKCQGERLDRALRWARLLKTKRRQALLCEEVRACGEWLGLFHRITERSGDLAGIYQRIEREFYDELAGCRQRGLDPVLADRVAETFEKAKSGAFNGGHAIVGRHCDFAPYNVWLAPDRITVIDFEGLQDGILYDDLCYFVGMVESTSFYHLSHDLRRRIAASFLEGYGRHQTIDQGQLDVFRLTAMVKIMADCPLPGGQAQGWLDRWKRNKQLELYAGWFQERVRL
jgi:colanic acid/amylovoran biosynthesis glycosyltransferase